MEKSFLLVPLFFLHLCSLLLSQTDYIVPSKFFINCGLSSDVTYNQRNFVGDRNSTSFSSFGQAQFASNSNSLDITTPLYQTARIFKQPSRYEFHIDDYGFHCIRLHFYPFKVDTRTNLYDALFDVSTSNFSLLSKFSVARSDSNLLPEIKEFYLNINESKFTLEFTPSRKKSFGFINAIEVFLLPSNFLPEDLNSVTHATQAGGNVTYVDATSQVLHSIHRINVGGPITTDRLGRKWIQDEDSYLATSDSVAKICVPYNGTLSYDTLGAGAYAASDDVYKTCRVQNSPNVDSNLTWHFEVSKNARHFVRLHFCDIVSLRAHALQFFMYIDNNYGEQLPNLTYTLAAPFYHDLVVDSDDSGLLSISVGSSSNSPNNDTAFLNGLEVMKFTELRDMDGSKSRRIAIIGGSIGGGVVVISILVGVFLLGMKWKKSKPAETNLFPPQPQGGEKSHGKSSRSSERSNISSLSNIHLKLNFSLREILVATNHFESKLLIGEGGFGKVYKGTLRNGMKVAVKRSDPKHGQGLSEFETEILVLSKIRHRHLVSLIGYCNEGSEMILVYEFMEKGTLRDHLYDTENYAKLEKLSWKQRLEICIGSARGLHYLHYGADGGIIHRDVKSTNILLDEHLVAKVADFGLSRSGPQNPDHYSMAIKGSFGYIDPEYFNTFQFTDKSDVYSFGVVLLEVLCARSAIKASSDLMEEINLAEWGMYWQKKGELEKIIDPLLVGEIKAESLRKFGETVEKCLSRNGEDRPGIQDVLWDLEYSLQLQVSAVRREPYEDTTMESLQSSEFPMLKDVCERSYSLLRAEEEADDEVRTVTVAGGK